MSRDTLLLVDDDPDVLQSIGRYLETLDYDVVREATGTGGIEAFEAHRPDVVVLDLQLPDRGGLEVLEELRGRNGSVILLTGHGDIETAVRAMQLGAENFLTKPVDLTHLGAAVSRVAEKARLRRENALLRQRTPSRKDDPEALGVSPPMEELGRKVRFLAESERTTVLLTGESGTGKGLVAELLHRLGPRSDRPFVEVNCAGLSRTFLDSELFGHEKGAFTDAKTQREGLFELAHTGTIFLDEIGDLDLELQPKLLKVLEKRTFRRLGGSREISVDVRILAATNRDIEADVEAGRFREDLFFRLSVTHLHLPPVRERSVEDRMHLVHRIVEELGEEIPGGPTRVGEEAMERLLGHPWPGNVREMRNVLERALIFARDADEIAVEHLPTDLRAPPRVRSSRRSQPEPLSEIERRHIERALVYHDGNRTRAAKDLGIARATLINKIKVYDLDL